MGVEYIGVLLLAWCSVTLAGLILGLSWYIGISRPDREKLSIYECGFDPFGTPRTPFSIRFYIIGLLFLVFDLEVSWLFPWSVSIGELPGGEMWIMYMFLFILTIGLIYEWLWGALEWE